MSNANDLKEFKDILKEIDTHLFWRQIISALFCVLIAAIIGIAGKYTICKCYTHKEDVCVEKKSPTPNSINLKFNSKVNNFKHDFSVEGTNDSNVRSECFWFIIFFISVTLLILLFYLISYSSQEKRLFQFYLDIKDLNIKKIKYKKWDTNG